MYNNWEYAVLYSKCNNGFVSIAVLHLETLKVQWLSRRQLETLSKLHKVFGVYYTSGGSSKSSSDNSDSNNSSLSVLKYRPLSPYSLYFYLADCRPFALYETVKEQRVSLLVEHYLSRKKLNWRCNNCGGIWLISPAERFSRQDRVFCPFCNYRKLEQDQSFAAKYSELMKDWDYSRNIIKPDKVPQNIDIYINWKCHRCGYRWRDKISTRVKSESLGSCPRCTRDKLTQGTSQAEITVYAGLYREFDCINRGRLGNFEFDIIDHHNKFAVEYDGYVWHRGSYKEDIQKNRLAQEYGYQLYRIREQGLSPISDYGCICILKRKNDSLDFVISKLIRLIQKQIS